MKLEFTEIQFDESVMRDPATCNNCGGTGEIVYGDGGGGIGKPHYTGSTELCSECEGAGRIPDPLIEEAEKKMRMHTSEARP